MNSGVHTTSRAPESASTVPSSVAVCMVETGTATAPARKQPRMAASMGSPSDIISSTRSSDRTPASRKEAATTPQSSSSSAYVVVSAARTATLSPSPSSTLRVTR